MEVLIQRVAELPSRFVRPARPHERLPANCVTGSYGLVTGRTPRHPPRASLPEHQGRNHRRRSTQSGREALRQEVQQARNQAADRSTRYGRIEGQSRDTE